MGKSDWCWVRTIRGGLTAMYVVSTGVDGQWACSHECWEAGHHVDPRDMQRAYPAPTQAGREFMLAADATRLAELREELEAVLGKGLFMPEDVHTLRRTESLIAVYEECAARGLRFGGG